MEVLVVVVFRNLDPLFTTSYLIHPVILLLIRVVWPYSLADDQTLLPKPGHRENNHKVFPRWSKLGASIPHSTPYKSV